MQKGIFSLVAAGTLVLALGASASPIYINPLGENSSDANLSLQSLIDARGNTLINVYNDQLDHNTTANWTGASGATVVTAIAGSANINTFGIYDLADPSQKLQLFAGGGTGDAAAISSPWAAFGFYLINQNYGNTSYSDYLLNGGQDHLVAYQGKGETIKLGADPNNPTSTILLDSNSYLLAWEDTDFSISDKDYNDFICIVSFNTPDTFSTVFSLGLAMMGLVLLKNTFAMRRKSQAQV